MTIKKKLAKVQGLKGAAETDIVRYAWRTGKNLSTLIAIFKTLADLVRACWDHNGSVHVYWEGNYMRVVAVVRDDIKKLKDTTK